MTRPAIALALLVSLAVFDHPSDALAVGRLAAARTARAAAAEAALTTAAMQGPAPVQSIAAVQPMAPAAASCAVCCPQPCLIYRHRGHHRVCCAPPIETVLTATNPCTCCPVAIPVCVPACCNCAPSVSCHDGLFCAGVVNFDWSCGYRVSVRFKHNGEVVVVSKG
jgi:hypothetical protein